MGKLLIHASQKKRGCLSLWGPRAVSTAQNEHRNGEESGVWPPAAEGSCSSSLERLDPSSRERRSGAGTRLRLAELHSEGLRHPTCRTEHTTQRPRLAPQITASSALQTTRFSPLGQGLAARMCAKEAISRMSLGAPSGPEPGCSAKLDSSDYCLYANWRGGWFISFATVRNHR